MTTNYETTATSRQQQRQAERLEDTARIARHYLKSACEALGKDYDSIVSPDLAEQTIDCELWLTLEAEGHDARMLLIEAQARMNSVLRRAIAEYDAKGN